MRQKEPLRMLCGLKRDRMFGVLFRAPRVRYPQGQRAMHRFWCLNPPLQRSKMPTQKWIKEEEWRKAKDLTVA